MNIRQLQYFCSVMRAGSFSRAAEERGVSVQAVSKAIVELEGEAGQSLFVRGSKGVTATPAARALEGRAMRAVGAFEETERFIARSAAGREHDPEGLRIALVVPPFSRCEQMCAGFSQMFSTRLGFHVGFSLAFGEDAFERLRQGSLDALVTVGRFDNPACEVFSAGTLPVGVFLGHGHPLTAKRELTLDDLAPYPVAYFEPVDGFNETAVNLYRANGLRSPVRKIASPPEADAFFKREEGFAMGVGIEALTSFPATTMRLFAPPDALPVQVCVAVLRDAPDERRARFEELIRSGSFNVGRAFMV